MAFLWRFFRSFNFFPNLSSSPSHSSGDLSLVSLLLDCASSIQRFQDNFGSFFHSPLQAFADFSCTLTFSIFLYSAYCPAGTEVGTVKQWLICWPAGQLCVKAHSKRHSTASRFLRINSYGFLLFSYTHWVVYFKCRGPFLRLFPFLYSMFQYLP
jgi:hypothetical protein